MNSRNTNQDIRTLTIDGWRAGIRFSSCHMIPHHEKCSRLHGHTYVLHLRIEGYPDENGFLMDFSIIKEALRQIADRLDHRVLLPGRNPYLKVQAEGKTVEVNYQEKNYLFPVEDVVILDINTLTAECLSRYIAEEFVRLAGVPENILRVSAGVDEGPGQGAWSTVEIKKMQRSRE